MRYSSADECSDTRGEGAEGLHLRFMESSATAIESNEDTAVGSYS